jgi:Uma2 family endonuclease
MSTDRRSFVTTTPLSGHFRRPLTIADYERLPEDTETWWELQEGCLVMMPPRLPLPASADGELRCRLKPYLPGDLVMLPNIDVNLELVPPDAPGHVRRPNLIVIDRAAYHRANREDTLLRASEVRLVVEIVQRGSVRMDHVVKRGEYAEAGIPYYWIIDLGPSVSLIECRLLDDAGYQDNGGVTGVFTTSVPFPMRIDLNGLVRAAT